MSRRQFRALAEALKNTGASYETCREIGRVCYAENPRFDMNTFLKACGVDIYA
jgi:hypothetical protein